MENPNINNHLIRKKVKKIRENLTVERKEEASKAALQKLATIAASYSTVLSFASFKGEINLWPLNIFLALQNKLLLPRIENNNLEIYQVTNLQNDLTIHPNINLLEPDPLKCKKISPQDILCAFIPALVFDNFQNRLGYGKGYYDRFLNQNPHIKKIGVGYREQKLQENFFLHKNDVTLDTVLLF